MSSIVSSFTNLFTDKTPFYAKDEFIKSQRIVGVALIVLGALASIFAPLTGGATAGAAIPLIVVGSIIIGASLIQQVVGETPGCEHGRVKRAVAGLFIMFTGPFGWIVGGILWHLSNEDNR
jgi:hypothetical protein